MLQPSDLPRDGEFVGRDILRKAGTSGLSCDSGEGGETCSESEISAISVRAISLLSGK